MQNLTESVLPIIRKTQEITLPSFLLQYNYGD